MQKEIVGKDAFRMGHEQAEERALHWVEVYFQAGFRNQDVSSVLSDTGDELENMLSSCGHCLFFFLQKYMAKDEEPSNYKPCNRFFFSIVLLYAHPRRAHRSTNMAGWAQKRAFLRPWVPVYGPVCPFIRL